MRTKKFFILIISVLISSCSVEDYDVTFGTTITYFYNQEYNRNVVVGEGLKVKPGIMLSGLLKNNQNWAVSYVIDPSIITDESKTPLPQEYYTLGNSSKIIIPAGQFQGYLDVTLDSLKFLADPKSLTGEYVIPVRLTESNDVDSINSGKNHIVMSVSYWAKQHGNYYYNGQTIRKQNSESVDTLKYRYDKSNNNSVRQLVTVAPTTLKMLADEISSGHDPAKGKFTFNLEVPTYGGGKISLAGDPDSNIPIQPDGESRYDEATKTFYLHYKYTDGQYECFVADTLVFRNRVRDVQADGQGVNEWRGF